MGARGFTQYQCMLPNSAGPDAARRFLELLRSRAGGLSRVRDQGSTAPRASACCRSRAPGSPSPSTFPVNDGTQALVDALNEFVIAAGGRVYLAKDAFTRQEHFRAMEPRLPEWEAIRRRWDPESKLRSLQSVRVLGDAVPGATAEPAPLRSRPAPRRPPPRGRRGQCAVSFVRGADPLGPRPEEPHGVKIVLLGGTKGIGRALGRLLIAKGHDLFLLGRDEADQARSARDLEVRGSRPAAEREDAACDLARPRDVRSGAGRRRASAGHVRHGGGHGRPVRHPGHARGGSRRSRPRC